MSGTVYHSFDDGLHAVSSEDLVTEHEIVSECLITAHTIEVEANEGIRYFERPYFDGFFE